jgi:PIN domain nuclease of toxin-antitoxin system
MNLLLDTHAFLWYYSGSSELSQNAKNTILLPENDFFVSIASLWEIAIKNSNGNSTSNRRLTFFSKML